MTPVRSNRARPTAITLIALIISTRVISASVAQIQNAREENPKFQYDVVSIKPHRDSSSTSGVRTSFNRPDYGISAENITVASLVQFAYQTEESRISGLPGWAKSDTYELEARVDRPTSTLLEKLAPRERIAAERQMLQALLSDRLKLAIHRETKQMPVYELTVAKNGSKLQPAERPEGGEFAIGSTSYADGTRKISTKGARLDSLVEVLGGQVHLVVLNKTGLTGRYGFTLVFLEDPSQADSPDVADNERPEPTALPSAVMRGATSRTLFDAIQEQLGLKLVSAMGLVEIIVIDHIERPSQN